MDWSIWGCSNHTTAAKLACLYSSFCENESKSHSVMSDSLRPYERVHGILQARKLEWEAIPFFRGSSQPRDRSCINLMSPALAGGSLPLASSGKPMTMMISALRPHWVCCDCILSFYKFHVHGDKTCHCLVISICIAGTATHPQAPPGISGGWVTYSLCESALGGSAAPWSHHLIAGHPSPQQVKLRPEMASLWS